MLEASAGEAMLVVGDRGLSGFRGLLLGSVSQQCASHSTVPVVIVREPTTRPERERIVVGVDGSANSNGALCWAVEEARRRGRG